MNHSFSSSDFVDLLSKIRYSSDNGAIFQGKFVSLDAIRGKCISQFHKKATEVDDKDLAVVAMQVVTESENLTKESPRMLFEQSIFSSHSPSMGNTPRTRMEDFRQPPNLALNKIFDSPRVLLPPSSEGSAMDSRGSARSLNAPSLYNIFWEMAITLFVNVASPYVTHDICFRNILELLNLLRQKDATISPAIFVALDIVIQRSMYELTDKVSRKDHIGVDTEFSAIVSSHANMEGIRHIENCVSILHNLAIPMCHAEQAAVGLGYLTDSNSPHSIGCKMSTLNRQLQELLAWTTLQNQSKLPINFSDDVSSQAAESLIDQTLALTIEESMMNLSDDVALHIAMKLSKVISLHLGAQSTIQKCGYASFPVFFCEDMFTLDFAVNTSERAGILKPDDPELVAAYSRSEKAIHLEVAMEASLKHIKACLKDFASVSMEILRQIYQNFPDLSVRWEKDMEVIQSLGNQLLEQFTSAKNMRHNQYPLLMATVNKYEQMQEYLEHEEKDRIVQLRKVAKALERTCREAGFLEVKNENSRARFVNLKMLSYDSASFQSIPCMVILDSQLPNIATRCLAEYISLDGTGKISLFFDIIRKFVKSHGICDSAKGFLSSFAWMVLALHVLLREQLVPNIHTPMMNSTIGGGLAESVSLPPMEHLRRVTTERFANISIVQLLDRFFRYYVEEFDLFSAVITLRRQGDLLPKGIWKKAPVLWRLSIEDPFELATSRSACDLGSTMSRPGQLTTFKALRRAIYGIGSILTSGADYCRANVRKFFSKTELIHLARKSDYMGAIINPPKEFSLNNLIYPSSTSETDAAAEAASTQPTGIAAAPSHNDKVMFTVSMLSSPPNNEILGQILTNANELLAKLPPLSPRLYQEINTQRSSAPTTQRSSASYYQQESSGSYSGNLRVSGGAGNTNPSSARSMGGFDNFAFNSNQLSSRSTRDFSGNPSPRQPFTNPGPSGGYNYHGNNYINNSHSNNNNSNNNNRKHSKPMVPSLNFNSLTSDYGANNGSNTNSSNNIITPPNTAITSHRSTDSSTSTLNPYASIFNSSNLGSHSNNMGVHNSMYDGWSDMTRRIDQMNLNSNSNNGNISSYGAPNSGRRHYQHNNNFNNNNNNSNLNRPQSHHKSPYQTSSQQTQALPPTSQQQNKSFHSPPIVPVLNLGNTGFAAASSSPVPPLHQQYWGDLSPRRDGIYSQGHSTTGTGSYNSLLNFSGTPPIPPTNNNANSSVIGDNFFQSMPPLPLSIGQAPVTQRSQDNSNLDASVHSNSTDYAQEISNLVMDQQQQLSQHSQHPQAHLLGGMSPLILSSTVRSGTGSEPGSAPTSARSYHLHHQQQQQQQNSASSFIH